MKRKKTYDPKWVTHQIGVFMHIMIIISWDIFQSGYLLTWLKLTISQKGNESKTKLLINTFLNPIQWYFAIPMSGHVSSWYGLLYNGWRGIFSFF